MNKSIIYISLILLLSSGVTSNPGGAAASLDLDLVQEAKVFAMPMIINTINKIYIEDMQVDHFEVKDMSINLDQVSPNDVMIGLSESDNAVKLTANNVAGIIKGSFKY